MNKIREELLKWRCAMQQIRDELSEWHEAARQISEELRRWHQAAQQVLAFATYWSHRLNPWPSMLNPYSGTLLAIVIGGIGWGGYSLYHLEWWGLFPLMAGIIMLRGIKWPKEEEPTRVWLITFFGQMTATKVSSVTLLFDWIPGLRIIGYREIVLEKIDHDFNMQKPIRTVDDVYFPNVIFNTSIIPDANDDLPGTPDWKSGGQKLRDFANVGRMPGVIKQLDGILTTWVQRIANGMTGDQLERGGPEIANTLFPLIIGRKGANGEIRNSELDDTRGTGIAFRKFQVIPIPPPELVKARTEVMVRLAKRRSEVINTETLNQQIALRADLYWNGVRDAHGNIIVPADQTGPKPTVTDLRNQSFQENLEEDGKVEQVITGQGINVTQVDPNRTKRG
ncbi:MAG: hypothetical protein KGI69_01945 [Patescibacteria group bacterium]|nr:hypothetical protein [Patescibacteria group bacterium]